ncbi:MAG: NADH-quinone oxidoreductase subunit NuoK [Spirochaetes bacterium]|nr:NADH-quinone oxidoreductase subunit NuoK [Spirochaetota bacterium]MBX3720303.1 NADH-quinone oxidoreductase subunit NuoK [Turneriella sp.]
MEEFLSVREIAILGFILFAIGIIGIVSRRNLIVVLMSVEIVLNAVNLLFVVFSRGFNDTSGQIMVLFVMAVAAAEAAVGLALVIALFRNTHSVMTDNMENLKDT